MTSSHKSQTFSVKGMCSPYDIVRFSPGQSQLVINDYTNRQRLWIKLDQRERLNVLKVINGLWKMASNKSVLINYCSHGLGVRDNQLLVCDPNGDCIHVLSTSGKETHSVNMPQGVIPYKAVAQLTSPGVVVMGIGSHQVFLVSERGEMQKKYQYDSKGWGV